MSDFESEEMGRRYWLDALTTSATSGTEKGESQENRNQGYSYALQYSEAYGTSMRWIKWTVRLNCLNVCRMRLSACR